MIDLFGKPFDALGVEDVHDFLPDAGEEGVTWGARVRGHGLATSTPSVFTVVPAPT